MLALTTKGRYAMRIMVALAAREGQAPVRKQEIAGGEGISGDYVEQILIALKAAGLVNSRRGVRGGFLLARAADSIRAIDVLVAAEGRRSTVPCIEGSCSRTSSCVTRGLWQKAEAALDQVFGSVTIASLAREAKELQRTGRTAYEI